MSSVQFDNRIDDDARRRALYSGDIFVYGPVPATQSLCDFAREMVERAFAPHDPRLVHRTLGVEQCVAILAELKPRFIHHPRCKEMLAKILTDFGCDRDKTYFDVPRLRSAMPNDYLTSGIAYAFHAHRDTWYSAPFCQLNWWLPIYELTEENCMAFHPRYFREGVKNSSRSYNYARWNEEGRKTAASQITSDTREQPHAEQPLELEPSLRILCPPGGLILFSGAQLHSTVPNTSGIARYSIDFRTVHLDDATARHGAANVDSWCTGTTMRDYLRVRDLAHFPEALIEQHEAEGANGYKGHASAGP
jgi:hypothetical protein